MIRPKQLVPIYVSVLMTPVYMRQNAKMVMYSENCSEVSVLLRRGVNAGTKKNGDKTQAIYFSHRLRPP
jgi:hypothetical protein